MELSYLQYLIEELEQFGEEIRRLEISVKYNFLVSSEIWKLILS